MYILLKLLEERFVLNFDKILPEHSENFPS